MEWVGDQWDELKQRRNVGGKLTHLYVELLILKGKSSLHGSTMKKKKKRKGKRQPLLHFFFFPFIFISHSYNNNNSYEKKEKEALKTKEFTMIKIHEDVKEKTYPFMKDIEKTTNDPIHQ
ncbi:hypothetical protein HMI55_004511 [Coelomomyces lativittatus]|nr:hypothetical protein HMI55_004511 [Coelomomyces lativittatus]